MCPSRPSEVKMNEKLLRAAQQGDADTVTNILDSSVSVKECLTSFHKKSGDTAAHLAARHGHVSILTVLNSFGASFEMENLDGKRALHEAAISGQDDCVKYLLSVKANVDPLKRADWTPLMLACTKSNLRVIQELVNHGADLRLRNKDGWNCFHIAAREGHADILKYILDCNNDIWDTVSKNGRTPLHTAALHGNLEAVKLFLQQCSYKVDSVDSCGTTPLMDAIRNGFIDTTDALINIHKADHMKSDTLGRQALHLAAQAGCEVSIHFLIEKCGAAVNSVTAIGGLSPLHLAAKEGQCCAIQCLLGLSADINITDFKGRTALHMAVGGHHLECVRCLLANGAIDFEDKSGTKASQLTEKQDIRRLFEEMAQ